jgi:hypothetical protein
MGYRSDVGIVLRTDNYADFHNKIIDSKRDDMKEYMEDYATVHIGEKYAVIELRGVKWQSGTSEYYQNIENFIFDFFETYACPYVIGVIGGDIDDVTYDVWCQDYPDMVNALRISRDFVIEV